MVKRVFDISPPKEKLKKEKAKETSLQKKPEFKFPLFRIWLKKSFLLLPLVLIVAGIVAYFNFSKVEIEIWPEMEVVTFETKLTVDKEIENINFSANSIPGTIFEEEKTFSQEFPSTGKKLIEKKAEGTIRVFNDSQREQILVAQTRFQPPLEKFLAPLETGENPWFRAEERVVVPAKGYKDVRVVADAPGEKYNIEPSTFSVPGLAGTPQYTFIYGKSFESMKDGLKKEVPEVIEDDLKKAEELLKERANKEIIDVLKNKIPAGFLIIEEAIKTEILEANSLAQAGAELEKFIFQVKTKVKTLSFKKEDLENFSKEFIISKIPVDKKLDQKSQKLNYLPEMIDLETGKIFLSLNLEAKIYSTINENSLKEGLAGKSLTETQYFLQNQPGINRVKVKFFPFWLKRVPENLEKIGIKTVID